MQLEHAVKMLLEASEERGPLIEAMMQKQADMQTLIDKLRRENYAIKERVASFIDMHKDGLASATVRCLSCHSRKSQADGNALAMGFNVLAANSDESVTQLPSVTSPLGRRFPSSQALRSDAVLTNAMCGSESAGDLRPASANFVRRLVPATAPSYDPELLREASRNQELHREAYGL
eukprot:gnl/TRDRNA2_/TRDRNA2_176108_c0_seq15.p1 gnl/TRDRNA2_/TRDRNA2_176108_c0~~gnl/TRDRNA2_/TRDRNA2_176108_c0_seq15.p1  ORF type:complete len:177 (+),score=21.21 gnl/TRDRNA2_/TRDRNA2_176108_c0_seq15:300-830(+)